MTELWKEIAGWPGYQVSNLGRKIGPRVRHAHGYYMPRANAV